MAVWGPQFFKAGGGGQNQQWPTSGQIGYITFAVWGGCPTIHSRGQNQRWCTNGQIGYITSAF